MKKKVKKLTLSKETLRKLNENQGFVVVGGGSASGCGYDTCVQICGRSGFQTC